MTGLETETLAAGLLIIVLGGLVRAAAVMLALSGRGMKHQESDDIRDGSSLPFLWFKGEAPRFAQQDHVKQAFNRQFLIVKFTYLTSLVFFRRK